MKETDGDGYDFVFDCAGHQSVADILPDVVKIRGKIEIIAGYKKPPGHELPKGHVQGVFHSVYARVYA